MSKSIAEIIGWTYVGCDDWVGLPWYTCSGDEFGDQVQPSTEPTVDDLLAWLRGDVFFDAYLMFDDEWNVRFVNSDSGTDGTWFSGPTLLAALESAVRAVASEA